MNTKKLFEFYKNLPLFKSRKVLEILIPVFTVGIGALIRSHETISDNFLFLIDQGRDMMAVKNIVFNHHLTLIGPYTSLQGVFQGPLWYYMLAVPTLITNGNPWGGLVLMLLISLTVLLIAYFFMNKFFGKKAAFFALFLFAVSPEAIAAATYTWNPHPMWLLILLYIFCFFFVVNNNNKYQLILWPLIAIMTNFESALAVFIGLATLIYMLIFDRRLLKNRNFLGGILLSLLFFLPQLLFDLRHNFLMTRSVLSLLNGGNQGLFAKNENRGYLPLVLDHISVFINNFNSGFINQGYLSYISALLLVTFILLGLFSHKLKLFSKKENAFISLTFRVVFIIFALSFIYPFPIRYWFLTGFQSFYILPLALIIGKLWKYFYFKVGIVILCLVFSLVSLNKIRQLYLGPVDYGGTAKIKGKIDAIDYIYKDAKGKPFGLLVFTPPVYTYAYDYLVWWYGENKYHYIPYAEKKGTFYLLIEPDPSKPWSYKGWLQTVIKTGRVIWTRTLYPSGFIIQKRMEYG